MKKILFSLVALMCCMSINAQVMKVMKNGEVVKTYTSDDVNEVVFEEGVGPITGTAMRTGDIEVRWVQLWKNGPKFAEYNVGVTDGKAESYGAYYCWGGTYENGEGITWNDDHNTDNVVLTGYKDTATNLWGNNWRMPTKAEFQALLANCDVAWTTVNGVNGRKFTGKGDYASNSVFLPAAGACDRDHVNSRAYNGYYWSSTPIDNSSAYSLVFNSRSQAVSNIRLGCYSVRAVLAE